ncbi:hypothetical protein BYT27DRAFT_7213165 [Phlegmacium glaucopus]|nr:hypothetical protein BYT27DRAFT_7213165 [Phlegmacium glaucopus]
MADPATCTGFVPNPAIFGIGVRVAFYVIGLLAAVTPVKSTLSPWHIREIKQGNQDVQPKREISSIVTVQGVYGLGLLVTAVIQTALRKLSLYHAFLIINLLFLLSTSFLYFFFNPNPALRRRWFFLLAMILLAGYSLYIGLHASTFGSQPECNGTVKIIWVFRVSTASFTWFRNFGICIFSIYIAVAAAHMTQLLFFRHRVVNLGLRPGVALRGYGIVIFIINVILIIAIEVTISVNKVPEDAPAWSFGQTLPIVMLFGPLCEVWDDNFPLIKAAWLKRRGAYQNIELQSIV